MWKLRDANRISAGSLGEDDLDVGCGVEISSLPRSSGNLGLELRREGRSSVNNLGTAEVWERLDAKRICASS